MSRSVGSRAAVVARLATVFVAVTTAHLAHAQAPLEVPPALRGWQDWVIDAPADQRQLNCPAVDGAVAPQLPKTPDDRPHVCVWYDALALDLREREVFFRQSITLYHEGWVALPGAVQNWPHEVAVAGLGAVAVVERALAPHIYLPAGQHQVSGSLPWRGPPLQVPRLTGLVRVEGGDGPPAREAGKVWLGGRASPAGEEGARERFEVRVYRLLQDGVPARLTTQLQLDVSGAAREVILAAPLPPGLVPTAIEASGQLSAQLSDGDLRLRIAPGDDQRLTIKARASGEATSIVLPPRRDGWPTSEVWSYAQAPTLRTSSALGANPVDPSLEPVPEAWRRYPAFRLTPTAPTLDITERQRGRSEAQGNTLALHRQLHLDFAGGGYTVADHISGAMVRDWRLEMDAPYELMAAPDERSARLITTGGEGRRGIEVRASAPQIRAVARLPAARGVPITGWSETMTNVDTRLNLPPGFRLLAAFGVDQARGAWLSHWKLLDTFLLVLTAVVAGRLFGWWPWSVVFGAMLLLNGAEWAAPPMALWLFPMALIAIGRGVSHTRVGQVLRGLRMLALIVFAVAVLPYAALQLRAALFPQLEHQQRAFASPDASLSARMVSPAEYASAPAVQGSEALESDAVVVEAKRSSSYAPRRRAKALELPASTPVQAGPGRPSWSFHTHQLSWKGPVAPDARMTLWIAPRWAMALWRVLAVLLMGVALARLLRGLFREHEGPSTPTATPGLGAATSACVLVPLLLGGLLASPPSVAQAAPTPDAALLQQLRERLLRPPPCAPDCVEVAAADIGVTEDTLVIDLEVHAVAAAALALPGTETEFVPTRIVLNGERARAFYRDGAGALWMPVPTGVSQVRVTGVLPANVDALQLPFPAAPYAAELSLDGWQSRSVVDGRLVGGVLALVRVRETLADAPEQLGPSELAPFVYVSRVFEFDSTWRVATQVTRLSPSAGPFEVSVPLLPFESPATQDVPVRDGNAVLTFADGARARTWTSSVDRTERLQVPWIGAGDRQEVWRFAVSPLWRIEFDGVPESAVELAQDWYLEFHPRPGETLALSVSQPEAVAGDWLAIDQAHLAVSYGFRATAGTLRYVFRATRAGTQTLQLPAGTAVEQFTLAGEPMNARPADDGRLTFAVPPGSHEVRLGLKFPVGIGLIGGMPTVDLGAASANLTQVMRVPEKRWVLWTHGSTWGPAVLYWAELAVFVLLAPLLARTRRTPLGTTQWLLLGLGFSTFAWGLLVWMGVWLFAVDWRERQPHLERAWAFNLRQVVLAVITVIVLLSLLEGIPRALLGTPQMHVTGPGSSAVDLSWFTDRSAGGFPQALVLSVPQWIYQLAILGWALWLSFALVSWLRWAWRAWGVGGMWRSAPREAAQSSTDA